MAKKQVSGISGVLEELVSPEPAANESGPKKQPSAESRKPNPARTPDPPPASRPCRARLGRPPGSNARHTRPKEKVTLRIPSDLISEYRDWSWEARCQLSDLVEQALSSYRKSRRRS